MLVFLLLDHENSGEGGILVLILVMVCKFFIQHQKKQIFNPVAFGIAAVAAAKGRELRSFSIRKESKDHGVEGRLAGALYPGDKVVICEDTVTRGTSPLEAAQVVRDLGADPVMILPVVDRGGTCGALASEANIEFRPLVTAVDLGFPYEGP